MGTLIICRASYQHCCILFLVLPLLYSAAYAATGNETDRLALLHFKAKITADPRGWLSNWNDSAHFCTWYGITCGKRHQRVTKLELGDCQLGGSISPHIANLTFLKVVDLSGNGLSGRILPEMGYLRRLERLNLSDSSLSGEIPSNLSRCTQLFSLKLEGNNLVGEIPKEIGLLSNLQEFWVDNNNLTGKIPDALGRLNQLTDLYLGSNQLAGTVPDSIFNLSSIEDLFMENNHLQGHLPSDLFLNLKNLQYLKVYQNNFTGCIPESVGNATQLPECLIAMNQYIGQLSLRGNNFSGTIPDQFGKNCSLEILDLNGNSLQGWIPRSLANCENLQILDLGYNQLSDTFPCQLSTLSELQVLVLKSNKFWGNVACPGKDSIWPLLKILDLASNNFTGELTAKFLLRWRSMVTGEQELQPKHSLTDSAFGYQVELVLTFKGNDFEVVRIFHAFTIINLSYNKFHGEIPREFGNLNALIVLNLSHNSLTGKIPSSFGNLSQIESLDLSCNALSGRIPLGLANLNFLEYLNLSFNKLTGLIPTGTQLQSFDPSSYEGNPGLYGPPLPVTNVPGAPQSESPNGSERSGKTEAEWMWMGAEVGFPVGLTIFVGPLLYIKRWREWYCRHLTRFLMKIMGREDRSTGRRRRRRRRIQQPQQRRN